MEEFTIRQTKVKLPQLSDAAELARVDSLGPDGGSISHFELAGTRVRALDIKDANLADGRIRECGPRRPG